MAICVQRGSCRRMPKTCLYLSGNFEPPARELRQGCSHIRLFTDEGVVPAGAGAGASVAG
jgi:hypothetical protein